MAKPKPTQHELLLASQNNGKLPESFTKRLEEWKAQQAPGKNEESVKDAESEDSKSEGPTEEEQALIQRNEQRHEILEEAGAEFVGDPGAFVAGDLEIGLQEVNTASGEDFETMLKAVEVKVKEEQQEADEEEEKGLLSDEELSPKGFTYEGENEDSEDEPQEEDPDSGDQEQSEQDSEETENESAPKEESEESEAEEDEDDGPDNEEEAGKEIETFDDIPDDADFPFGYGGGMHYLSNGKKVRGKKAAEKAQEALDKNEESAKTE